MNSPKARHKARTFAIQALYQAHFNEGDMAHLIAEFRDRNDYHTYVDWDLFKDLIETALSSKTELDAEIVATATRPLKEMNPTELAILRAASAELKTRIDVPYQVVLSEDVDLAAEFGAAEGHQFINAVLDRLAVHYRPLEKGASHDKDKSKTIE
jgi:transcription antitermination protein NusB